MSQSIIAHVRAIIIASFLSAVVVLALLAQSIISTSLVSSLN